MTKKLKYLSIVALLVVVWGCTANQVISDLQIAVDAASVAFPIVAGVANLPEPVASAVMAYLQATDTACSQAASILNGPGTQGEKAAAIVADFAGIAAPLLPTGTPQVVVSVVQQVALDIAKFLSNFVNVSQKNLPTMVRPLTVHQVNQLTEIKAKAESSRAAIAGWKLKAVLH